MHPMQLRSPCVSQNGGGDRVQPHGFSLGQVLAAIYDFYQEQVAAEEQLELLHVDPRLRRSVQVEKSGMHLPHQSAHGAVQYASWRILARLTRARVCAQDRFKSMQKVLRGDLLGNRVGWGGLERCGRDQAVASFALALIA